VTPPRDDAAVYDVIGRGYVSSRQSDPRIAAAIDAALGDARSIVNVGAGAGSYEPRERCVTAVEPSREMIAQRAPDAAPVVQGRAEQLPFADSAFDAALAVLTIHHWGDRSAGLEELRRVARRVVVLTWDPAGRHAFWLTTEYLPAIIEFDLTRFPAMPDVVRSLGGRARVQPLPVPHDCVDGFLGAYWRRPEQYLDPEVRAAMSGFAQLPAGLADEGLARLADDLRAGRWDARFGRLRRQASVDLGYRLVIADA
jgi:SAM-dependent methyltransferase